MAALTPTTPGTPGRDPASMPSRRDLLGATAGALALAVTAAAVATPETLPASHPDAELLRACGNLVRAEREYEVAAAVLVDLAFDDPRYDPTDARVDALVAESRALARLIGGMPRVGTRAALEARAAALRAFMPVDFGIGDNIPIDWHLGMLNALLDEIGGDVGPSRGAAPLSSDAELLAACAAFDAIEAQIDALDGDRDAVRIKALERERLPLLNRLCELRARTPAGLQARATTLVRYAPELLRAPSGYVDERLTASLLRDLVGGGVA